MTGALLFLNAWGQQLAVPAKQETGSSWIFFFFLQKTLFISTQQTHDGGECGRNKPRDRQTGVVSFNFMPKHLTFSFSCAFQSCAFTFIDEKHPGNSSWSA